MVGIDTNVLIRWLRQDPDSPDQSERARRAISAERAVFITLIALVEAAWVFDRRYRVPRDQIANLLRTLLGHSKVRIERRDLVAEAAAAYESGGAGLADRIIALVGHHAGARTTLTFDKQAAGAEGFTLID